MSIDPSQIPDGEFWAEVLLASFRRRTGSNLLEAASSPEQLASQLWESPWVVVAHGTEPDPVFHYGNRAALQLWEMPLEEFLGMPSRLTAEPMHREERERILARTRREGYVDDYCGIRISKNGNRFRIEKAWLWMVDDREGKILGQAAAFRTWTNLSKAS